MLGIPDFRVFPGPYIDIEADHRKGRRIAESARDSDFRARVEYYWSITPEEPFEMAPFEKAYRVLKPGGVFSLRLGAGWLWRRNRAYLYGVPVGCRENWQSATSSFARAWHVLAP